MTDGFRLTSILGFEIRIHPSWFIIFFLILWTLGFIVFPQSYPGQGMGTYVAMAAVGTVLFFASLVAHELSHSLVARRKGITVSGITLFVFGGMAHTSMEFEDPGDEFQVAAVGPLSSLVIAGLFHLLAEVGERLNWTDAVTEIAGYLAVINLALAVFNLLPGFPLDGGRILRAAIWKLSADLRRATRYATIGGQVVAVLLMALGVLSFITGNLIGGLWLVFIGWFTRGAAEASYTQLLLRHSLRDLRAGDLMTPAPYTIAAEITLEEFVDQHLFRGRHRAYPVVQHGQPVGTITLDRVRRVPRKEWPNRTVGEAMAALEDTPVVPEDERMDRVLERIGASGTGRVLVSQDGALVGIITRSDVSRWMQGVQLREGRQ